MWKTYSGEILFRVGSHVFGKAGKSLKAGEENVLHDEARIESDSIFLVKAVLIWVNAFLSRAVLFWVKYLPENNCTSISILSFMTKTLGKNVLIRSVSRMHHWRPSRALVRHAFHHLCLRPSLVFIKENSLLAIKPLFFCMRFTRSTSLSNGNH